MAVLRGQDVLLTLTPLPLPFQKPLTQALPQPGTARESSSTAGKIFVGTMRAASISPARGILAPLLGNVGEGKARTSIIHRTPLRPCSELPLPSLLLHAV